MKKIKLLLAASAVLALSASASVKMTQADLDKTINTFPKMLKNEMISVDKAVVEKNGMKHLGLIAKNPRGEQKFFEVFVFDDAKNPTMVIGRAYDKNGDVINLPVNKKIIESGVSLKIGTGPKQIYVVTDPECPYSKRLYKNIKESNLKKITINVITMPLSYHKESKPMLYWVLSAKTDKEKAKRLKAVMSKNDQTYKTFKPTKAEKELVDNMIEKSNKAASELGAKGTPSVYDSNFKQIDSSILTK